MQLLLTFGWQCKIFIANIKKKTFGDGVITIEDSEKFDYLEGRASSFLYPLSAKRRLIDMMSRLFHWYCDLGGVGCYLPIP